MQPTKVLFDHDGGVDDLLSLMLLLTYDHVDLLGVTITPADCYLADATESTLKILKLFGRTDIPVAQGNLHGVNAFPSDWRAQPKICNALPMMLNTPLDKAPLRTETAAELIADTLLKHQDVTVLMTGPCSNLVAALDAQPQAVQHVKEMVWMGGAVDVQGNVVTHNHDVTAEWNAFWDPPATKRLFEFGLAIKLIALDATNALPVNIDFLQHLAAQSSHPLSDLAGQFWATTINTIPSYEFTYYMWDVLSTAYLGVDAGTLRFERQEIEGIVAEPSAGRTKRSPGSGQWVEVAVGVDKDVVLSHVQRQFDRPFIN